MKKTEGDADCHIPAACHDGRNEKEDRESSDPRGYCYIISRNKDVCRPKTCCLRSDQKSITETEKEIDHESENLKDPKKYLIRLKKPKKTCNTQRSSKTNVTPEITEAEIEQSGSKADIEVIADGSRDVQIDHPTSAGSGSVAGAADANIDPETMENKEAVSLEKTRTCQCCTCKPCVCGPRGLNVNTIIAALKMIMGGEDDLQKSMSTLGPGAFEAIKTILEKGGEEAAMWATGGGTTESRKKSGFTPAESPSIIAMREAWLRGDFDEMKSCHCLPGMCPCPGEHQVYRKKKTKQHIAEDKKRKKSRKVKKRIRRIGKDGSILEEWVTTSESDKESRLSETCVCPPTKHYLTPVSSETEASDRYIAPSKKIYWGDLMVCTCPRLQRTLVIIKPDVVRFKDVIYRAIENYGLDIISERKVHLSPEEASEIYSRYYGLPSFPNMIVSISQAPVIALSVGGIDAVKIWRNMIGPDGVLPSEWFSPSWISRKYGLLAEIQDALYGSKTPMAGERDNRYFFPENIIDPVLTEEKSTLDYIGKYINPTLVKGLAILAKTRPIDPILFLAEWLVTHNPFQPHFPINISLAPT